MNTQARIYIIYALSSPPWAPEFTCHSSYLRTSRLHSTFTSCLWRFWYSGHSGKEKMVPVLHLAGRISRWWNTVCQNVIRGSVEQYDTWFKLSTVLTTNTCNAFSKVSLNPVIPESNEEALNSSSAQIVGRATTFSSRCGAFIPRVTLHEILRS